MKPIAKNPDEPADFTQWRTSQQNVIDRKLAEGASGDTLWELLPSSLPRPETEVDVPTLYSKSLLRRALLEEQGYICCYCNRALQDAHTTVIEHFYPKGLEIYRRRIFEYQNLLVCCDGGERDRGKPRELYCTLHKGNKDPLDPDTIISPLDQDCLGYFEFNEQGQIHAASGNESARKTIDFLGLQAKALKLQREKAISTYILEIWTADMNTDAELKRLMTPVNGKFEPFCSAIYSVLRHYP